MHAYNVDEMESFYDAHELLVFLFRQLVWTWWSAASARRRYFLLPGSRPLSFLSLLYNAELSLFLDQFAYVPHNFLTFITVSSGHDAK